MIPLHASSPRDPPRRVLHVGLDDTDSKKGMCTTYLAVVLMRELAGRFGGRLVGHPRLVRLNPNCPYKTRGNAALAFDVELPEQELGRAKLFVLSQVPAYADMKEKGTDPGVAFVTGELPEGLAEFSREVVTRMVSMRHATSTAKKLGIEIHRFGYGRGIIGAMAAMGNSFDSGSTYELIAYRTKEHVGTRRAMDVQSVMEMDRATSTFTFDNFDYGTGEVRIMPHTPCPVYFGIRGTDASKLEEALKLLRPVEPVETHMVFKTNQGTDAHIRRATVADVRPGTSVRVRGIVTGKPRTLRGGHVFFDVSDGTGSIACAAYEPTKGFRSLVAELREGDAVEVYGGAKKKPRLPITVNLEKIKVESLAEQVRKKSPPCPECGRSMKSEGKGKGYQCPRCKFRDGRARPMAVKQERRIKEGLYAVPPRARRHLSRPAHLHYQL